MRPKLVLTVSAIYLAVLGVEFMLAPSRSLQRKLQFRADFVNAENSMSFHAPQETARVLGEALDFGRQAELAAVRARLLALGQAVELPAAQPAPPPSSMSPRPPGEGKSVPPDAKLEW